MSALAVMATDLASKKRKKWRDEYMRAAIHAVQHEQLKISNAAKIFSIRTLSQLGLTDTWG